jgi:hypothetical protein
MVDANLVEFAGFCGPQVSKATELRAGNGHLHNHSLDIPCLRGFSHHFRGLVMKHLLVGAVVLLASGTTVFGQSSPASPAAMISDFRLKHGEGRVTLDATLTRIAHEQAMVMAAKDQLDHDVLGRFNARVSPAGAGRAAENIAYGYDTFPKTLDQWINSSGHRRNLLLHNGSRIGVANVKSSTTGRTYWAMVIAGDYERPKLTKGVKQAAVAKPKARTKEACRLKILSICL